MIGIAHEPSREILDALNEALGEGTYSIAYHDGPQGIAGIIRMREAPQREFKTYFARDAEAPQVEAVWQELVARTIATLKAETEQEQAAARAYRPEPEPANEVKPGEAVPGTITGQTDVTESEHELVAGTTLAEPDAVPEAENKLGHDHSSVAGGTGTSEHAASGGGDTFESSTADERKR